MRLRRKKINLGTYRPPRDWPESSVDDSVDDAMLVAVAAVRMSLKNLLIVRALRHKLDYSADALREAVQLELENLALEKDSDAQRVESQIESAGGRIGKATHQSDYREADLGPLTKRHRVLGILSAELRTLALDDRRALELIEQAKREALDEVLGALVTMRTEPKLTQEEDSEAWSARRALLVDDLEQLRHRPR